MNKEASFFKKHGPLIHYLLPTAILEVVLLILLNFHLMGYMNVLCIAIAVVVFPFFDFTVYENSHSYRFGAGIIASIVMTLCMTLGSFSAYLGVVWVVVGLLIPVILMVVLSSLPGKLKINGILSCLVYTIGIGSPMPVVKLMFVGKWIFIGGVICTLFFFLYYKFLTKFERVEGIFFLTPKHLRLHFSQFNPRRIRFGVALYVTTVVAYIVSVHLSYRFPQIISLSRANWAPFFVFGMLVYTDNKHAIYVRITQRFIGTIIGILIAMAVIMITHNPLILSIVFIIATMVFMSINFKPKNFTQFVTGASIFVMFLYVLVMRAAPIVLWYRFVETIVAIVIAILAIVIFWPLLHKLFPLGEWEKKE